MLVVATLSCGEDSEKSQDTRLGGSEALASLSFGRCDGGKCASLEKSGLWQQLWPAAQQAVPRARIYRIAADGDRLFCAFGRGRVPPSSGPETPESISLGLVAELPLDGSEGIVHHPGTGLSTAPFAAQLFAVATLTNSQFVAVGEDAAVGVFQDAKYSQEATDVRGASLRDLATLGNGGRVLAVGGPWLDAPAHQKPSNFVVLERGVAESKKWTVSATPKALGIDKGFSSTFWSVCGHGGAAVIAGDNGLLFRRETMDSKWVREHGSKLAPALKAVVCDPVPTAVGSSGQILVRKSESWTKVSGPTALGGHTTSDFTALTYDKQGRLWVADSARLVSRRSKAGSWDDFPVGWASFEATDLLVTWSGVVVLAGNDRLPSTAPRVGLLWLKDPG